MADGGYGRANSARKHLARAEGVVHAELDAYAGRVALRADSAGIVLRYYPSLHFPAGRFDSCQGLSVPVRARQTSGHVGACQWLALDSAWQT